MKRKLLGFFCAVLMLMVVSAAGVMALTDQDQLDSVNDKLKDTKKQLNEGKQLENKLNREISSLENQINQTQREINALSGNIAATKAKVNEALTQLEKVEKEMEEQNDQLSHRLRAMYKNGGIGVLDVLLGSDSITDFMSNMDMVRRIFESDKKVLKSMEVQHQKIDVQKQYLMGLRSKLEREQAEEAGKQHELVESRSEVSKKKSEVAQNNKALAEQAEALLREANRLTSIIRASQGGGEYSGGIMIWPVSGRITSPFGSRTNPITKRKEFHTGIDIAARSGTNVAAANDGVVQMAGWNNSYGNMVVIDHGGGIATLYAHNSALLVNKGDNVVKGQAISQVGSTGMSTGPHLHFEVRVNGEYKNPREWL